MSFFNYFVDLCLWLPFLRSFCHVLFPLFSFFLLIFLSFFFLSFFLTFVFSLPLTPRFLCFYLYFITYSRCLPFLCLYPSVFLSFSCLSIVQFPLFLFVLSYFLFNTLSVFLTFFHLSSIFLIFFILFVSVLLLLNFLFPFFLKVQVFCDVQLCYLSPDVS